MYTDTLLYMPLRVKMRELSKLEGNDIKEVLRDSKMAPLGKVLAIKTDNLSLILGTYLVLQVVPTPTGVLTFKFDGCDDTC